METLLCTVNLSPNTISDDRFSIGLIMAKGETLFFNYSEEKLQKLKSLFSPNAFLVIHQYLKSLYNQFYNLFCSSYKVSSSGISIKLSL